MKHLKEFSQEDSFSVLFREENNTAEGQEINNYIKDKKLNAFDTNSNLCILKVIRFQFTGK